MPAGPRGCDLRLGEATGLLWNDIDLKTGEVRRHSAASLLIAAGVELVEVSMLLGHSELRVTADLYSHLQKQTAARAARRMDAVLSREGVS